MIRGALDEVRLGLRLRRRRTLQSAIGIALAAAMLSAAIVIADSLGAGFDRAASAADLPDVIVRFDPQPITRVASRIQALPDIAAFSTRAEFTNVEVQGNGHSSDRASLQSIGPGRRGYAIVAGHDLSARFGEIVLERGFAQAWRIPLGGTLQVGGWARCESSGSRRLPTTSPIRLRFRGSTSRTRRSTRVLDRIRILRSISRRSGCATDAT